MQRSTDPARVIVDALVRADLDVDASRLARILYASDASLYRVEPLAVVFPHHAEDMHRVLITCRELGTPVTIRGAGTSLAGNAVGHGVIVDTSRHLNRILEVNHDEGWAVVQPGVVHAQLQRAAAGHGLRFGPDPSSHSRATIGGMIGNNACGSRALGYGRTSDNVVSLKVLTGTGDELDLAAPAAGDHALLVDLKQLVHVNLATIRQKFGTFPRQISGYALDQLLPEKGCNVARALVGSEGTLALVQEARVRLIREPPVHRLLVLGFATMAAAADHVVDLLPLGPVACEGLDSRIVDVVRERLGPNRVPELPAGSAWLMVEFAGGAESEVMASISTATRASGALGSLVASDPGHAAALWRIREDGSGLVARTPDGRPCHAGWEDAAVPPARLGRYLREFDALLNCFGLFGVPYGHFGDGCVHVRIDFPLDRQSGGDVFAAFLEEASRLAAAHGGSMSGEHGDGRARSALLRHMYGVAELELFSAVKRIFDPENLLNPGIIVDPAPVIDDVRALQLTDMADGVPGTFNLAGDSGSLMTAVHRCTGIARCRADDPGPDRVMCPSYRATRDEKDSTRGRARVLQDVVSGRLGPNGWRSPELHEALDLCLACKGCSVDCPTGVDISTYKAEALYRRYRHRPRPMAHYSVGWFSRWTRLLSRLPLVTRAVNASTTNRLLHRVASTLAGVDHERDFPRLAPHQFRRSLRSTAAPATHGNDDVVLFADTFTNALSPEVGHSALSVLRDAGYAPRVPDRHLCCGLTWISTGQLHGARRQLARTVRVLANASRQGSKIVVLEPSCAAVLRHEAVELLTDDLADDAGLVARSTRTLAELLLETPGWEPPDLSHVSGVAQPHCHQHAVLGWDSDSELLKRAGATFQRIGGCCGLAGNFGFERGHASISAKVAENDLLPAIRAMGESGTVLADGVSCRIQVEQLARTTAIHLAQLLARVDDGTHSPGSSVAGL